VKLAFPFEVLRMARRVIKGFGILNIMMNST
jgi:hypothetical protein